MTRTSFHTIDSVGNTGMGLFDMQFWEGQNV